MKRWFGILTLLTLTAAAAPAQMPAHPAGQHGCGMMAMKKSSADDAKLQAMLDDMNKAQGQAKVDKMAAVINELIAQRSAMQSAGGCPMSKDSKSSTGGGCCSMMKKGSTESAMECH